MKPTRRMIYRLLQDALLEMRVRAYQRGDEGAFALCDMFHNVPSELDMLDRGELSVQDIMRDIREHAQQHDNAEGWLDHRMRENARQHPETTADNDTAS